ncbi:MAG: hypothetical protein IKY82_05915 [Alistipes sp.]|nr:hypothetical protein [Alistipes sp.]
MKAPSIDNSDRRERQAFVEEVWKCLNNCEMCGKCRILRGKTAEAVYADYIDGKRSYRDVTLSIRNNNH